MKEPAAQSPNHIQREIFFSLNSTPRLRGALKLGDSHRHDSFGQNQRLQRFQADRHIYISIPASIPAVWTCRIHSRLGVIKF